MSSFGEPAVSIATEMPELCFFVFVFQLVLAHLSPYFPFALFPLPPLFFQACMPPRIRPEGLTFYCHVLSLFSSHERPSGKKTFFLLPQQPLSLSLPPCIIFLPPSPSPLSQLEMGALHCFRPFFFGGGGRKIFRECTHRVTKRQYSISKIHGCCSLSFF